MTATRVEPPPHQDPILQLRFGPCFSSLSAAVIAWAAASHLSAASSTARVCLSIIGFFWAADKLALAESAPPGVPPSPTPVSVGESGPGQRERTAQSPQDCQFDPRDIARSQGRGNGLIHPELPVWAGARLRADRVPACSVILAPVKRVVAFLPLSPGARSSGRDEPIPVACSRLSGAAAAGPLSASIRSIYLRSIHP